jgi:hypothetical protein
MGTLIWQMCWELNHAGYAEMDLREDRTRKRPSCMPATTAELQVLWVNLRLHGYLHCHTAESKIDEKSVTGPAA